MMVFFTYPQCFMFCGLSILTAILMDRSSGQFLVVFILCHSAILLLFPVGRNTTYNIKRETMNFNTPRMQHNLQHKMGNHEL